MPAPSQVQPGSAPGNPPVQSVDGAGNEFVAGTLTVGKTVIIDTVASAPIQSPAGLTLYTTDGSTLSGVGANGVAMAPPAGAIPLSTVTTKGDLIVGTGNAAVTRVGVGADGTILTAASGQASGVQWAAPAAAGTPDSLPPSLNNLLAWTMDQNLANSTYLPNAGIVSLQRIVLPVVTTVTNIVLNIAVASNVGTSGQNFVGFYNPAGTRLGVSADTTTAFNTTGDKVIALTAPLTNQAAGTYYVAVVTNASTNGPAFSSPNNTNPNTGIGSAPFRAFNTLAGQTSLPASITMTSGTKANSIFFGIS